MKKRIPILLALAGLILIAAPLTAQKTLGLRGGAGFASVSVEEEGLDSGSRSGIVVSADLTIPGPGLFDFRVGGAYVQKGGGFGADELEGLSVGLNIDYAQFSGLARIGRHTESGMFVGVMAGPWIALRLSCNLEASAPGEGVNISSSCSDAELETKALDYGIALGVGADFPMAGMRLGVDVLYSLGLAPVAEDDDAMTRHLAIQAGVNIPIG